MYESEIFTDKEGKERHVRHIAKAVKPSNGKTGAGWFYPTKDWGVWMEDGDVLCVISPTAAPTDKNNQVIPQGV